MLPQKTQELITERIKQLPDYMQEALNTVPWQAECEKIAVKYRLDTEDTKQFIAETALLLTGLEDPARYGLELHNRAHITEAVLPKIAAEVQERVFNTLQKYVLDNNAKEIEMFHDEIEVLRQAGESDIDVFNVDAAPETTEAATQQNLDGTTEQKSTTTKSHDPYHEVVDPDDLLM